jgi:hypothetical protein
MQHCAIPLSSPGCLRKRALLHTELRHCCCRCCCCGATPLSSPGAQLLLRLRLRTCTAQQQGLCTWFVVHCDAEQWLVWQRAHVMFTQHVQCVGLVGMGWLCLQLQSVASGCLWSACCLCRSSCIHSGGGCGGSWCFVAWDVCRPSATTRYLDLFVSRSYCMKYVFGGQGACGRQVWAVGPVCPLPPNKLLELFLLLT